MAWPSLKTKKTCEGETRLDVFRHMSHSTWRFSMVTIWFYSIRACSYLKGQTGRCCWPTWLGSTGRGDLASGTGAHVGPGAEAVSAWTPTDRCKGEKGAEWSNIKTRSVRWKTGQCLLYGARIWPAREREFMLRVCCLSACLLQVLNFKPHTEFWSTIFQNSNRPQSKYGHILLLTLIMVKLQEPSLKHLPAIFSSVVAINVHQVCFGCGLFLSSYSLSHRLLLAWSAAPSSHQVESSRWPLLPEPHC